MNGMKWIKIATDIFEDEKIFLIESSSKADTYIVIWFKLLCLAGKQNSTGVLMMNDKLPYTSEMLATIFRRPHATVEKALKTFENYGMIELIDGVITIPNWEKHQALDRIEEAKEKTKKRVAAYRKKQKEIASRNASCNASCNARVTPCNAVEEEGDKEGEERKEKKKNDCERIVNSFHSFCPSLPLVKSMTEKRKEKIDRILDLYSPEEIEKGFRIAQQSRFLTGGNDRHWLASFDWLMDEEHFAKVLEGNYSDPPESREGAEKSYDLDDFFEAAVRKGSGRA